MNPTLEKKLSLDWTAISESLSSSGYALTGRLLSPAECAALLSLYSDTGKFRSQVVMERYRFGKGDYKYFRYPLPPVVQQLRESTYPHLARIANLWRSQLLEPGSPFPDTHEEFLKRCNAGGQKLPTPLMLHYEPGGYNCLHQDIYGEIAFPLQIVVMLGQQGKDWSGGEFVLVENVPRAQSRAEAITVPEGHGIVFTTRHRPVKGSRGWYRAAVRHGVSRIRRGTRYTLGIVYHDAK
jgi:uncharacterized protein